MTLRELFESDEDGGVPVDFPQLILEVPETVLASAGIRLNEGSWQPSRTRGLWYRVDPARPEMNQKRHVHVADNKHIKTSTEQVSWNQDATRHDRHRFNASLGSRRNYQDVAKEALGLPRGTLLEFVDTRAGKLLMLLESGNDSVPTERYRYRRRLESFSEFLKR